MKEISLFRLPTTIDPAKPFRVEVMAARPKTDGGEVSTVIGVDYALPDAFRLAPPPSPEPLWRSIWAAKQLEAGIVAAMLVVLTLILFAQDGSPAAPKLWRWLRISFLTVTLVVLGWGLNGQLVGGAGRRLRPFAADRVPLGDLPDRAGHLPALVLRGAWACCSGGAASIAAGSAPSAPCRNS